MDGFDGNESDGALVRRRIVLFLVVTFAMTWTYWFGVTYPLANGAFGGAPSAMVQLSIAPAMFFPALGALITRLVTHEGLKPAYLAPVCFRRTWKLWVVGWLVPAALILCGAALWFVLNSGDFSIVDTALTEQLAAQGVTGLGQDELISLIAAQLALGVLVAPFVNAVTCFGEEWGWRGYLLIKVSSQMKIVPTVLLCGVIWGLWHAPVIALGHNYGTGYWGFPFAGVLAMCVFCTVVGAFLSYLTLRSGSCSPAILAHGSCNSLVSAGLLFSVSGGNAFLGPMPIGIIGGAPFVVCAAIMVVALVRRERRGEALLATRADA